MVVDGLIKFPQQNKELDLAVDYGAVQSGIGNLIYTAISKNIEQLSKGLMRNKVCRKNEVILFFAKAQKQRIVALFNDFCNAGKGQKNKFECKIYFVSNPKYAICCTAEGKSSSVVMWGNFIEP